MMDYYRTDFSKGRKQEHSQQKLTILHHSFLKHIRKLLLGMKYHPVALRSDAYHIMLKIHLIYAIQIIQYDMENPYMLLLQMVSKMNIMKILLYICLEKKLQLNNFQNFQVFILILNVMNMIHTVLHIGLSEIIQKTMRMKQTFIIQN